MGWEPWRAWESSGKECATGLKWNSIFKQTESGEQITESQYISKLKLNTGGGEGEGFYDENMNMTCTAKADEKCHLFINKDAQEQ